MRSPAHATRNDQGDKGAQTFGKDDKEHEQSQRSSLHDARMITLSEPDSINQTPNNMAPNRLDNFAEEIENEAAEIRTLIARTAQLWSEVDRAERTGESPVLQSFDNQQSFDAPSLTLALPYLDNSSTFSSDTDECDTETGSNIVLSRLDERSYRNSILENAQQHDLPRFRSRIMERNDYLSEDYEREILLETQIELQDEQREEGEMMDASNRAINASKARAIKTAMYGNLIRLGFHDTITRAALEAGVLEIDHYDSDCELAYVDIFLSLVKMVSDAHVDVINENDGNGTLAANSIQSEELLNELEQRSFLPFKWPVFDMAQFEFGNARPGTCFNSVSVLTNLPKVSMDRTEELMEVLSCNLFCMIGDPIQVVIPSASSTGRTKGHAFLEFDHPDIAKKCAAAVDGLTWGRGPFGRIRGNLFRQYQVNSPGEMRRAQRSATETFFSQPFEHGALPSTFEYCGNRISERFRPDQEQHMLFCDSDEDSSDEWVAHGSFHPTQQLNLSSDSVDMQEQNQHPQPDTTTVWSNVAQDQETLMMSSEGHDGDENSDGFDNNSVVDVPNQEEEKLMDLSLFDELLGDQRCSTSRCSPISLSSGNAQVTLTAPSTTSSVAPLEELTVSRREGQAWNEVNYEDEKPWQKYCEELILRNREMQEQMAFARRRIVHLSQNNQKLHLLIDRVERDRDSLLFENDLLHTQVHGYEDHEQHHNALIKQLVTLRKQKEQHRDLRMLHVVGDERTRSHASSSFGDIQSSLLHVMSTATTGCNMEELKQWEHLLETTLSHVRSVKEEVAVEMQKKLDRKVEEQNELKLCVICLSNEKTILCLPCRHLCLCKICSGREEVTKCPICRLDIEETLAVYS